MNCESIHKEYKKLRTKEKEREDNSTIIKRRSFSIDTNSGIDSLRVKKLSEVLMSKCKDYVEGLSAEDRFDIRKVAP